MAYRFVLFCTATTLTILQQAVKNEDESHKNNLFRSFDDVVCKEVVRYSQLECLVYPRTMVVSGTYQRVISPREKGTLICCAMRTKTVARGTNSRVSWPRETDKTRVKTHERLDSHCFYVRIKGISGGDWVVE